MNQGPGVGHRMGPDCYQSGTWCRTTDRARLLSIRDLVWDSRWSQTAINQGSGVGHQMGPDCYQSGTWSGTTGGPHLLVHEGMVLGPSGLHSPETCSSAPLNTSSWTFSQATAYLLPWETEEGGGSERPQPSSLFLCVGASTHKGFSFCWVTSSPASCDISSLCSSSLSGGNFL